MDTRSKVIELLTKVHSRTGGHCGLTKVRFGIPLKELKPVIIQLKKEKLITAHDNAHGTIYKLKKEAK